MNPKDKVSFIVVMMVVMSILAGIVNVAPKQNRFQHACGLIVCLMVVAFEFGCVFWFLYHWTELTK